MDLHTRLVKAWKNMPDGAKTRVQLLGQVQQTTSKILNNPNYKDTAKMESLLNAIKQASKDVTIEVTAKNKKVQKLVKSWEQQQPSTNQI